MTTLRRKSRRAFTMLELLVVIGIIVVLIGIILSVMAAVGSAGDRTRTESTMRILEGAVSEWESRSNRQLTWGTTGVPVQGSRYDMQESTPHIYTITDMLRVIARSGDIQEMLAQISDDQVHAYRSAASTSPEWLDPNQYSFEPDPDTNLWLSQWSSGVWDHDPTAAIPLFGLSVLDAWDRPIRVIHPGRRWQEGDPLLGPDPDGTVRTPLEDIYGVCVSRKLYFVSSGPDREFGINNPSHVNWTEGHGVAAQDNLYSYEVDRP